MRFFKIMGVYGYLTSLACSVFVCACPNKPSYDASKYFCHNDTINFYVDFLNEDLRNSVKRLPPDDNSNLKQCRFEVKYDKPLELKLKCNRFLPNYSDFLEPLTWNFNGKKNNTRPFEKGQCKITDVIFSKKINDADSGTYIRCETKTKKNNMDSQSIKFELKYLRPDDSPSTDIIPLGTRPGYPVISPRVLSRMKRESSSEEYISVSTKRIIAFAIKLDKDKDSRDPNAKIVGCYPEKNNYNFTENESVEIAVLNANPIMWCSLKKNNETTTFFEGISMFTEKTLSLNITKDMEGKWNFTFLSHRQHSFGSLNWSPQFKYDNSMHLRSNCSVNVNVFQPPPVNDRDAKKIADTKKQNPKKKNNNNKRGWQKKKKKTGNPSPTTVKTHRVIIVTTPKTTTPVFDKNLTSTALNGTKKSTVTNTIKVTNNITEATKNESIATSNVTLGTNNVTDITNNVTDATIDVTEKTVNITEVRNNETEDKINVIDISKTTPVANNSEVFTTPESTVVNDTVLICATNNSKRHETNEDDTLKTEDPGSTLQPQKVGAGDDSEYSLIEDFRMWIGVVAGCCLILIVLTAIACRSKNIRSKIPAEDDSSNVTYENLNNEHNQFPPNIERIYAIPIDNKKKEDVLYASTGEPTYSAPYVEKDLKELYAQPVPKSLRRKNQPNTDLYTQVLPKNQRQNTPTYGKVLPKSARQASTNQVAYAVIESKRPDGRVVSKIESDYAEVAEGKGHSYGNVFNGERYANAKGSEYAEPAYCQLNK